MPISYLPVRIISSQDNETLPLVLRVSSSCSFSIVFHSRARKTMTLGRVIFSSFPRVGLQKPRLCPQTAPKCISTHVDIVFRSSFHIQTATMSSQASTHCYSYHEAHACRHFRERIFHRATCPACSPSQLCSPLVTEPRQMASLCFRCQTGARERDGAGPQPKTQRYAMQATRPIQSLAERQHAIPAPIVHRSRELVERNADNRQRRQYEIDTQARQRAQAVLDAQRRQQQQRAREEE